MPRTFLVPVDLNQNELRNARVQNLATAPATPLEGQLYYDTDDDTLYVWTTAGWAALNQASSGIPATIVDVKGDIIAATAADTVSRLAAGADDTILMADAAAGTGLKWAASAVPGNMTFGAAAAIGTADTFSRGDHAHGGPTHDGAAHSAVTPNHLGTPTADKAHGGFKITNLGAPTADSDAATKLYVDNLASGISWKDTVRAATSAAGTLATSFANGQVIDGVTLATGDRILVKNQAAGAENGVYVVQAAGAPVRATDADSDADLRQASMFVQEGTVNAETAWVMTNDGAIVVGTTALVFVQFSGLGQITAGNGLTKTANVIDVVPGVGLAVVADAVAVLRTDTDGRVPIKYASTIGNASLTTFTITHNLNSLDVIIQVYKVSTGALVDPDILVATVNTATITFTTAPATNEFRVVCYG